MYVELEYFDLHTSSVRGSCTAATIRSATHRPGVRAGRAAAAEQRWANISLSGGTDPSVLAGLDPDRLGRDRVTGQQGVAEGDQRAAGQLDDRAQPDADLGGGGASRPVSRMRRWSCSGRRSSASAGWTRTDPVAAWTQRMGSMVAMADRLTRPRSSTRCTSRARAPTSRSACCPARGSCPAAVQTAAASSTGQTCPSEEAFTTPDPKRVDGTVRSTKPLDVGGTVLRGLRVRFQGGRAVAIDADAGRRGAAGPHRHRRGRRRGWGRWRWSTARAGSASSARCSTRRCWTRTRPATSRSAGPRLRRVGRGRPERINRSEIHIDFMIGGDDVEVTGVTADGDAAGAARREWQV